MCRQSLSRFLTILAFACCAAAAWAQQMSNPYGPPVTLEAAKKIAVPALAEAWKNGWTMAVAIVDPPATSCTSNAWTTRSSAASTPRS